MNKNMRFLSSVFVLCVFGVADAHAVPSVKMLGSNSSRVGTSSAVAKPVPSSVSTATPQRLSSVRFQGIGSSAPVSVNKVANTNVASDSDESRLSVLKKVQVVNKPKTSVPAAPTPATPGITQQDFTKLSDRVSGLEVGMDLKQDALSVGDNGLVMEDNVIYLDESFAGLPNEVQELKGKVNSKVSTTDLNTTLSNYYNKEEIANVLSEHDTEVVETVYDKGTNSRKYISIVDTFDEDEFLEDYFN